MMSKFVLVGSRFMPEMHLKQPAARDKSKFTYSVCGPFEKKTKKEHKNLNKLEILDIIIKMSYINHAIKMIWFMEISG